MKATEQYFIFVDAVRCGSNRLVRACNPRVIIETKACSAIAWFNG